MTMLEEKTYKNKDLILPQEEFEASIANDFIGDSFIDQLEWSMMMIQDRFKQIRVGNHLQEIKANQFDRSYLLTDGLNNSLRVFKPHGGMQATPEIFDSINVKTLIIGDSVQLRKFRQLSQIERRHLSIKRKYAYEHAFAFYKKDTECFYGVREGYEVNPEFFKWKADEKLTKDALPHPISLHPAYKIADNAITHVSNEWLVEIINSLKAAYQVAFSMYYEWGLYIKDQDSIGLIIPINPVILSELYSTSMLKFDSKKRMLHFVRDHYRRKIADQSHDYSVFVKKYLRGEYKFNYNGFYAEIIPPRYDLNRVKTRKKFVNPNESAAHEEVV